MAEPVSYTHLDVYKRQVYGHNQITDLYLLALAVAHKGALATFDHNIALRAVTTAGKQHLVVL